MIRLRFGLLVILFNVIIIFAAGETPAHVVSCGDILGPDGNTVVIGDNNRLINVTAASSINSAFTNIGNNNQLSKSIAQCGFLFFGECIFVSGDGNRLSNNFAWAAVFQTETLTFRPALGIRGNYNQLSDSIAQCGVVGAGCITLLGDKNRLTDNFVQTPRGKKKRSGQSTMNSSKNGLISVAFELPTSKSRHKEPT